MRSSRFASAFHMRLISAVLALVTAMGPIVLTAAAVHELEHPGQHIGAQAPHDHVARADQAGVVANDGDGGGEAFHRLAHAGHCCAQGAAITSYFPELAGERAPSAVPRSSISEPRQSPPVPPFRPPIAS